jgi:hypothetical protein
MKTIEAHLRSRVAFIYFLLFVVLVLMLQGFVYPQQFTEDDMKELFGITSELLITEKIIQVRIEGADTIYAFRLLNDVEKDGLFELAKIRFYEERSYKAGDLVNGVLYSIGSGLSLGIFESNVFGYSYPKLKDGKLKEYLTWNTPTDKVFGKIFYPQKISRELLFINSRLAINSLQKFFNGKWYISYPVWWIVHNTVGTVYRDWAKTGNASYSFDFSLIFP